MLAFAARMTTAQQRLMRRLRICKNRRVALRITMRDKEQVKTWLILKEYYIILYRCAPKN
jgi:hypothetical protein